MTDDEYITDKDGLINLLASLLPDMIIKIVDEDGNPQGELMLTNQMPECSECGTTDTDQAFQDPRFADGQPLCEFCYAAQAIEWERTHK